MVQVLKPLILNLKDKIFELLPYLSLDHKNYFVGSKILVRLAGEDHGGFSLTLLCFYVQFLLFDKFIFY